VVVHFKHSAFGDNLLNQHEMHEINELLAEARKGIAFSTEDAKKAEKYFIEMISKTGIDKMISLFNILKIMCRSDKKVSLCSENYSCGPDENEDRKMNDIYSFISANFYRSISLAEIAGIAGMKPAACSRYFKKNSGVCFVEYVNQVRKNKACYLLRESDYQVNQIAEECGFASISNFHKQFRKSEGISPGEYRTRYKAS